MLLINMRPVQDDFLVKYAEAKKVSKESLFLSKTASFKLSDSFFRVVRQREVRTNMMKDRVFAPVEFNLEATYRWFNPFTGLTELLTYTENFLPNKDGISGGEIMPVAFEHGYITVSPDRSDLYFWLNNHPLNQTNPLYSTNQNQKPPSPFKFRELLPDMENSALIDHEVAVSKATLLLTDKGAKGYVNDEALKYLAKSYGYGSVVGKGRKDVVAFLLKYVKQNPQKVLDDLTSAATEVRAVLADAIQYGVVREDLPYIKWVDLSKSKRTVNNGVICQVPNGMEAIDYFVNWMREKDNSGVFGQLKKELEDKKLAEIDSKEIELTA